MGNNWIYTGDNFATNRSSVTTANDKIQDFEKSPNKNLDLSIDLGYGSVTEIIKDESEDRTGIKVLLTRRNNSAGPGTSEPIVAYPLSRDKIKIPIINETVFCVNLPSSLNLESPKEWYYISDINLFGNSNNNLAEDVTHDKGGSYYGETFNPVSIPDMKLFEGDTLVQGRFGNKIRFGSTNVWKSSPPPPTPNDWSFAGSSGSPITIISNGGSDLENLDDDPSSIYLTSDQSLPIYLKSPLPKTLSPSDQYSENSQVVIASDKLVFYTKDGVGDIVISGKGTSYLMGKKVHLTTEEWSNVDVTTLMDIIEELINQLEALCIGNPGGGASFATGAGPTGLASNWAQVNQLKIDFGLLKG